MHERPRPYDRPQVGIWMAVVEPDGLLDFARRAEEVGADSVWVPDHLIWPDKIESHYPYRSSGAPPVPSSVKLYDPWALLAAVATATSRIKLGTCVYVLPLRDPLVTARAVATVDVLSGGRTILGAGLGWMAEEFEAAGIPFKTRASRNDEIVAILRSLWSEELTEADGKHISFPPVHFYPKPPQGAGLPIVFGGESIHALRRAVREGDGWLGTWHTPESTRDRVGQLTELLAEEGRLERPFEVTVMIKPKELDGALIEELYAAGADRIVLGSPTVPLDAWPGVLDRLEGVLDQLGLAPAVGD
jgi:probable F420-dependent oxidoreductase